MMHSKSESDSNSVAPSSPRSPKRTLYYVQSPSQDGDKSSSIQEATPVYNSPMESPSHPSLFGPHSLASSASRVSGTLGSSCGRKWYRKRNYKGWNDECNVIEEDEEDYDDDHMYGGTDQGFTRACLIVIMGFVSVFSVFCLIIWGASRPYKTRVAVESLTVDNFYFGEGSDLTGVPTKFLTVNCSVKIIVDNPATFFGIHVSSSPINLFYSEIAVATGQLKKYFQPIKSQRVVYVNLEGDNIPLYGAGASLAVSDKNGGVPLKLEFEIRSRGNLVGKLVKTKHQRLISCYLAIASTSTKAIIFKKNSCTHK